MSYSTSEAKIAEIVEAVDTASSALSKLHRESERIVARIDGAIAGAAAVEAEIDANAGSSDLWLRLQEKKNQVKADMQSIKASAETIESGIEGALP